VFGLVFQQREVARLRESQANLEARLAQRTAENAALAQSRDRVGAEIAQLRSAAAESQARTSAQSERTVTPDAPKTSPARLAASPADDPALRQVKDRMHERYDPFLTRVGLTPTQKERFVELKLAIYDAQKDLQVAVEQNSVEGGSQGVEALRSKLTKPMWDEIRELLGEHYKDYGKFEESSAFRPTVVGLFRAANLPLTEPEIEQVTQLLINNRQTFRAKPTDISSQVRIDWLAVARDAQSLLTAEQVAVLQAKAEAGSH
jgi:hypothetical protein